MPFADELGPAVTVADYNSDWPAEFTYLADRLRAAVRDRAVSIDHVGSTSVPGLPAKNCIDAQIRVTALSPDLVELLEEAGFRCRPEPWNRVEISSGHRCEKFVFAPPVGERATNVHVRLATGPNARYALLFRDYLRADETARQAWGAFKLRLAQSVPDFFDYGQIKAPATDVLMTAAERWADHTNWTPS
ncbi:GrpB family protein [Kribbella sp. NPDC051586]|uniref:GrpB family protein n=1 Tax=Kribbella sp. NPDC051586 TaxID=3364118 RepID=UPI0037B6A028